MKKIITTLIAVTAIYAGAFAQQRNCGTMDYYYHRLEQDPSLADRMAAEEEHIQKWTEEHPTEAADLNLESKFPSLPGFQATGNDAIDRKNYEKAKEEYQASHSKNETAQALTPEEIEKKKAERKNNQIIPVKK